MTNNSREVIYTFEEVKKVAKSDKTGRDQQNNQGIPQDLTDIQKAEQALKEAKNRGRHC